MAPYYYITYSAFCITGMGPMGPCTLHALAVDRRICRFPISEITQGLRLSRRESSPANNTVPVAFTPHFTAHHPPSSLHIMHVTIT